MPTPRQLSRDLRLGESPDLTRRRWIVGLSLLGTAAGQLVGLFQTGIVPRLPDPPSDLFDSSRVDASDYAYSRLQTPDAFVMIATYAVTAGLAAAGGKDRAREQPWLPIATLAKTLYDSYVTLNLAREEWRDNRALCAYCQAATLASLASAALAVPEAVKAVRNLQADQKNGALSPVAERRPD
jgi:uncharacterized membrane protein